jgi:hypothetical protein
VAAGAAWWRVQFPPARLVVVTELRSLHRRAPIPGCAAMRSGSSCRTRLITGTINAHRSISPGIPPLWGVGGVEQPIFRVPSSVRGTLHIPPLRLGTCGMWSTNLE